MRVHKNKILNIVVSVIMAVAMVVGLCTVFDADTVEVNAASNTFEKSISGFPDSYKPYLRTLHAKYPKWKFVSYNTGINFTTAVSEEFKDNKSLIENAYSKFLKSNASGDYNVSKGTYIPKDGGNWVTTSKNAIAYFMDPRNFLNTTHIYMFESLSFDSETQTQAGVEAILDGSFMYKTNIGYITTAGKYKSTNTRYSAQIMSAAKSTKVSAYYLASKILQEIGTKKNSKYAGMGASGSVSGQYSKAYTGIYNFYNIGAYSGANPIANGLSWASSGKTYGRPWTTPGKSILGGAQYIGEKYINCGQNTTYYQRFNVNKNAKYSLYTHQYMTNIYGAASEASFTAEAYESLGIAALEKTFIIPVFNNMPNETNIVRLGNTTKSGSTIASVNLRKGPSTGYKTLVTLSKGDAVKVNGGVMTDVLYGTQWLSNPYWYKVSVTKNGKSYNGYLAATYVNLNSEKNVAKGEKVKLPVTLNKSETVYYMSDNPAIATVDSSGYVTGIKNGFVTIRAFLGAGSMGSMTIQVGGANYKPKKPVMKGASKNYKSIKLTWTPESGVSGYMIYKKNAQGKYALIKRVGGSTSSYIDTKLTTGQAYSYKLKAFRKVNKVKYKSAKSKTVTVRPIPGRTKIKSIVSTGSNVVITWKQIKGASGYKVYRSEKKNGTYKEIVSLSGKKSNTFTNRKLTKGRTYYYKVAAFRNVSGRTIYGTQSKIKSVKK